MTEITIKLRVPEFSTDLLIKIANALKKLGIEVAYLSTQTLPTEPPAQS
jgi:hypothetical protein